MRHVATTHPYDDPTGEDSSLRGSTDVVAAELAQEVAQRVAIAGVEIVEVRISHLAYASEIARAMLRREQANALVAVRSLIAESAVGMVEHRPGGEKLAASWRPGDICATRLLGVRWFLAMALDELDSLLAEQVAYYRARAREYDATHAFDAASRAMLLNALRAFAPRGRVLELACGTGQWTAELARHASLLTAVDASPEMIALNRERVQQDNVHYVEADLFAWSAPERYDVVFFSVWLSHVPPQRFEGFWALVTDCLKENGRVFLIDELPAAAAHERWIADAIAPVVERRLTTGACYQAIKVLHDPAELGARLSGLGWRADIRTVSARFFYAMVERTPPTQGRKARS